jgi:anti-sigma factor RsiW
MLCDDVKRVVYFFLDGTLGELRNHDYHEHLTLCPDCDRRTIIHRRLRAFVDRRLERLCAPERFKTRLSRSRRGVAADQ